MTSKNTLSALEEAINKLKKEGYSSKEIRKALYSITEETKSQKVISIDLDKYLDSLED